MERVIVIVFLALSFYSNGQNKFLAVKSKQNVECSSSEFYKMIYVPVDSSFSITDKKQCDLIELLNTFENRVYFSPEVIFFDGYDFDDLDEFHEQILKQLKEQKAMGKCLTLDDLEVFVFSSEIKVKEIRFNCYNQTVPKYILNEKNKVVIKRIKSPCKLKFSVL